MSRVFSSRTNRIHRVMATFVALFLVMGAVPAFASDAAEEEIDAEFQAGKLALEAYRAERLDLLEFNFDAEIAAFEASHDAQRTLIDETFSADRAAVDASHDATLLAIDVARDAKYVEIDAEYAASLAAMEALYAELMAELSIEGLSTEELKVAFKAAEDQVKEARDADLDALKAGFEADRDAADAAFDALEAALKAELDAAKDAYDAAEDALKVQQDTAFDVHDARTDALLAPHEAEKKYWEAEKKAIEKAVDAIYRPQLEALKDADQQDSAEYKELDAERKDQRATQTVLAKEMIAELKTVIDEIKDEQDAIEDTLKDTFDAEFDALKAAYDADEDYLDARIDDAKNDHSASRSMLEDDSKAAEDATKATYEAVLDQLHDQAQMVLSDINAQTSRLDDNRTDAIKRADSNREAARKAENKTYEQAKKTLDRHRDDDRRAADRTFDSANNDAERRYDRSERQIERSHDRNMNMLESEHFILRQRVRAFLASDGLVPLSEFYDPHSDPGSLFNVTRRIKADHDEYTGAGVQVALIDTGIVDVAGLRYSNVVIGPDFSFEDADEDLRARDGNGHGTHMAGIIVGSDAAYVAGDTDRSPERVLGVAPAATLVSVKVGAADGAVDVTQVIAAIDWVISANASGEFDIRVINLSFGTNGTQGYAIDPMSYAVERAWHAGIVVVVAAGNDGLDATLLTNPATNPYVIAVGSGQARNGHELVLSGFSNGSDGRMVDVVAPGRSLVSFRNPGSFADVTSQGDLEDATLVRGSGTSQAAAVVTGVVALMIAENPSLTPDQVKWALMDTAKEARDAAAGAGFIQANKAIGHNIPSDPATYTQTHATSNGTGSIDAARGDVRVTIDGAVLEGEVDIFGNSWTGNSWTGNSWTGNSWTGNSWTGNSWTGNSWTGNSWTGNSWTGNSWTGNSWTGNSWTGNSWTGNSWTGNSWTGNSWTGNSWTGNSWTGNSWTGNSWTGNSWTSVGWGS